MPRKYINSADNFCYICAEVTFARKRKAITAIVKKAHHLYFGCKIGDQDKSCAPHACCHKCATNLLQWLNGKWYAMLFAGPMVWREPSNHATDCYSVWCHLFLEASRRKRSGQQCSRINHLLSVQFRKAKKFPFPNLRKNLPSIQTTRTKASRPRVLLSRWRLLNHRSPTVGLVRHSYTFSHKTNWTILFAIWSCPRAKQSYWDQDLNNEIFSRKLPEFLRFAVVISIWCLSSERKITLCFATM